MVDEDQPEAIESLLNAIEAEGWVVEEARIEWPGAGIKPERVEISIVPLTLGDAIRSSFRVNK